MLILAGLMLNIIVAAMISFPVIVDKQEANNDEQDSIACTYSKTCKQKTLVLNEENVQEVKTEDQDLPVREATNIKSRDRYQKEIFLFSVLKSSQFLIYLVGTLCYNISMAVYYNFLPSLAIHNDTSQLQAVSLLGYSGIIGSVSRLLLGVFMNTCEPNVYLINTSLGTISGVTLILAPWICQW